MLRVALGAYHPGTPRMGSNPHAITNAALVGVKGEQAMTYAFAKATVLASLLAALSSAVGLDVARADPFLPTSPVKCRPGYVWREARPGDTVCVTPAVRTRTAQENQLASSRRAKTLYPDDSCIADYVWREAFEGDHVCVPPDSQIEAAADNAAAPSRIEPDQPVPLQGPSVSWEPRPVGGLTALVRDRSGQDSQCTYESDWYTRSFFLPASATYELVIFPAIPEFRNWNVAIRCDNGTVTKTQTYF